MTARVGLDVGLLVAMFGDPEAWCGVSASGAGATIACPTRLALPGARTSSEAADRGTALHEFARVCTVNPAGRAQALLDIDDKYRHTAEGMNLENALRGLRVVGCEQAYAINVKDRTVRFIGTDIDRKYAETLAVNGLPALGRYEIPFSIDVEAFFEDVPVELDYKSGQSIGDPAEHWQRRICAMGLMLFHDASTAISRVAYIWDDGRIEPDGHEFSILDVDDFCDELVKAIDAVWFARLLLANGIMPDQSPSDLACSFCPAYNSCPYQTNFAKAMLGRLAAVEAGPEMSTLTPEEKGKVWEELKHAEKIIDLTIKALKGMAAMEPIPIGTDKEVRPKAKSTTYFDDAKARGLIVQLMGRLGADEDEIEAQLAKLRGKTEFVEFRTLKKLAS